MHLMSCPFTYKLQLPILNYLQLKSHNGQFSSSSLLHCRSQRPCSLDVGSNPAQGMCRAILCRYRPWDGQINCPRRPARRLNSLRNLPYVQRPRSFKDYYHGGNLRRWNPYLHLQPWRWRRYASPKNVGHVLTSPHSARTLKMPCTSRFKTCEANKKNREDGRVA